MSASVSFVIQRSNNAFKGVVRYSALLAFFQEAPEPFKFALRFFKQAQPGSHHLARRAVAAIFNLRGYKLAKVGAKCNTGVSSPGVPHVPNIGMFCQSTHNKARQADAKKRRMQLTALAESLCRKRSTNSRSRTKTCRHAFCVRKSSATIFFR